jgi:hypothetical protein
MEYLYGPGKAKVKVNSDKIYLFKSFDLFFLSKCPSGGLSLFFAENSIEPEGHTSLHV